MPMQNPQAIADRWGTGMANSGAKAKASVQALTVSPTTQAANAVDRMVAGFQRAAADGRIVNGLNAVTLQSWQNDYLNKGIQRMTTVTPSAKTKVANFLTQFLPVLQSNVAALPPRGTLQDNINRATQLMMANAQFKYNRQSG